MLPGNPQFRAYAAMLSVCVFWGTTYLGIRMALEAFSPATLVCLRYLLSGSLMLAGVLATRTRLPPKRELLITVLCGVIILGVGNGCLAFAEVWIPSGLAAMFITTQPFWMIGMEALLPGGDRLHGPTIAGMLVGLAGTMLLVGPGALANGLGGPVLKGFLILQLGCLAWSFGSILQRRAAMKTNPVVTGGLQQLATGLVYIVPALLMPHAPVQTSPRAVGAIFYLALFGGIVGYSSYIYALQHLPVSIVSLYNYVNPVVAVLLGFLVYREKFGLREMLAMLVIFAGVALVKHFSAGAKRAGPVPEPRETAA